ncbi:NAD(P)-dependent oxidoreductase [Rhodospirillaceae bacterium KN72]|uniref:NAD(P)-dependent oxidoreductase n=1 Tax=Pacificispira spongiicola TaxID=2729598 RepID=A0A7Y0E2W2_9PROT|nr:NAD(P)-dependent oxidoreductase [Pacificispira spongiicola]NMM46214.1 NAD(P)-dependent oxidoreductase [Pacificispira spongiicola]
MNLSFIGFGEAARAFTDSLKPMEIGAIRAYDILQAGSSRGDIGMAASTRDVALADGPIAAVEGADIVFSAVTAADSLDAAKSVLAGLRAGQTFIDINSVSGDRKRETADLVRSTGAAYIDMAVMAPVHPRGHRTPVLVAGDIADDVRDFLIRFDFDFQEVDGGVGTATSIKMVRSLFVKGLEAVTVQSLMAAEAAGCYDRVYGSLAASFTKLGWPEFPNYQFERVTRHGRRRAAEMRESAVEMRNLGFPAGGDLADAIAAVQDMVAFHGAAVPADAKSATAVQHILHSLRVTKPQG